MFLADTSGRKGDSTLTRSASLSPPNALARHLVWFAGFAVLLALGTLALWGYYGTAVFFEMVRAGWAACF
jgi:hypothetical protein